MSEQWFAILYKFRFLLGSALVIACLFLLSFILSITTSNYKVSAASTNTVTNYTGTAMDDDPNVVANLMTESGNRVMQVSSSTQKGLKSSLHSITTSIVAVPVQGAKVFAGGARNSASFIGKGAGSTFAFISHTPGKVLKMASPSAIASATIRPADAIAVPKINAPKSAIAPSVNAPLSSAKPSTQPAVPASTGETQWPIHGAITTLFGVPEWPYEAIHTGLDISDGNRPGVTPIRPYKSGRITQVIHSSLGLGNHIVVDHGGGMTSVYGHLNSTSVQVGQSVNKDTILGYEGTTGASTGPHLHFEIRINGQPVNPLNYINGRP
jgi:murein DD-endopeptidase MepM/ murein hydrolase activator NlpD